MKICLAQSQYFAGDIRKNYDHHRSLTLKAIELDAAAIFFPELSLTGYEPDLIAKLSFEKSDMRLLPFQVLSNENRIMIGLGVPFKRKEGITISMAIFQPDKEMQVYDKKHLHADEIACFVSGNNLDAKYFGDGKTALAICYELSILEHAEKALSKGVKNYLASVAKFRDGVASGSKRLSEIASDYNVHTLMVNGVGEADGGLCTGNSAVWGSDGQLLAQLDDKTPGLLLFDTDTYETRTIENV